MSTAELVAAAPPQALLLNRMMVDGVVETPNGAHFTSCVPDYGRDEAFQRAYADRRRRPRGLGRRSSTRYLSGDEAAYQAAVARRAVTGMSARPAAEVCAVACADLFRDDGEILASPMGTMPMIGARLARLTTQPDLLLSDGEALPAGRDAAARAAARRSRAGCRTARCSTSWPPARATS